MTRSINLGTEGDLLLPDESSLCALLASTSPLSAQTMKPEFHYTLLIGKPATEVWSALTEKKIIDQ